jgi:hypothetical protein
MKSLWVEKSALEKSAWQDIAPVALADGQILLEIEKYALTANNITYAVVGDGFGYWNFFPTGDDGQGIVPVWGFAKVAESAHPNIAVGERLYGYLPMASHLLVSPKNVSEAGFVDGVEHRQGLAIIYNQYHRLGTEESAHEDQRARFQPLFTTSFLIEHMMRDANWFGAGAVVLTSASSKTALGLAMVAKSLSPGIKRIGLTSASNVAFVAGTGLYDEVRSYDDLSAMDNGAAVVSVDFAGNSQLLADIHAHWEDNLKFSSLVGATHVDGRGGGQDLKGPKPELFFAPTAAEVLIKEVGPVAFRASVDAEFDKFVADADNYLTVEQHVGMDALEKAYLEALAGDVSPNRGIICAFG